MHCVEPCAPALNMLLIHDHPGPHSGKEEEEANPNAKRAKVSGHRRPDEEQKMLGLVPLWLSLLPGNQGASMMLQLCIQRAEDPTFRARSLSNSRT